MNLPIAVTNFRTAIGKSKVFTWVRSVAKLRLLFHRGRRDVVMGLFMTGRVFVTRRMSICTARRRPPDSTFSFGRIQAVGNVRCVLFLTKSVSAFFLLPATVRRRNHRRNVVRRNGLYHFLVQCLCIVGRFSNFRLVSVSLPKDYRRGSRSHVLIRVCLLRVIRLSKAAAPQASIPSGLSVHHVLVRPHVAKGGPVFANLCRLPQVCGVSRTLVVHFRQGVLCKVNGVTRLGLPLSASSYLRQGNCQVLQLREFRFSDCQLFSVLSHADQGGRSCARRGCFSVFRVCVSCVIRVFCLFRINIFRRFPYFLFFFLARNRHVRFDATFARFLFFFSNFFGVFLRLLTPRAFVFQRLQRLNSRNARVDSDRLHLLPVKDRRHRFVNVPRGNVFAGHFRRETMVVGVLLQLIYLRVNYRMDMSARGHLLRFFLLLGRSQVSVPMLYASLVRRIRLN